jgi:hypothetical protein
MQLIVYILTFHLWLGINIAQKGELIDIQHDHHGNLYLLFEAKLEKYDTDFRLISEYDLPESGYVTSIDVSNPMRILIFSDTFNTIQFLDNYLNPLFSAFHLTEIGHQNVSAVCTAARGGFWIFDEDYAQIFHIDMDKTSNIISGELHLLSGVPNIIRENNRQLYLGVQNKQIYVFNEFGAYIKTLPIQYDKRFIVTNNFLYYQQDSKLFQYNLILADNKKICEDIELPTILSIYQNNIFYPEKNEIIEHIIR